ncbi:DUF2087 domain-containing protein [Paenibacillus sp. y28]|uniref:DUF2087 domain-containing protein n=1 Tax=Paenibacillus sp. y28 TaxID=3129110 RepID=UPI003019C15F
MSELHEMFWSASLDELKRGYVFQAQTGLYTCLICGTELEQGIVFADGERLYEAEKFMQVHINAQHQSMFHYLLQMNKRYTGLTDHQRRLLDLFQQGLSDAEIVKALEGGSTSTIRNHRFTLREKEKQAKVFLALMELLHLPAPKPQQLIPIHRTAAMVDERFAITEQEHAEILEMYFKEGLDGPLSKFPKREKRKRVLLKHIVKRFDSKQTYTEKEVQAILKPIFHDHATLRRYFIEYGFMERKEDGSAYWVKE